MAIVTLIESRNGVTYNWDNTYVTIHLWIALVVNGTYLT